jgi:hypothetical protein
VEQLSTDGEQVSGLETTGGHGGSLPARGRSGGDVCCCSGTLSVRAAR